MDIINFLPNEILNLIVEITNNHACKVVCKRWKNVLINLYTIMYKNLKYDSINKCHINTLSRRFFNVDRMRFMVEHYDNETDDYDRVPGITSYYIIYDKCMQSNIQTAFIKLTESIIIDEKEKSFNIPLDDDTCYNLKNIFSMLENKALKFNKKCKNFKYIPMVKQILKTDTLSSCEYINISMDNNIILYIRESNWNKKDKKYKKSKKILNLKDIKEIIPVYSTIRCILSFSYYENRNNLTCGIKPIIEGIECIHPPNYHDKNIKYNKSYSLIS